MPLPPPFTGTAGGPIRIRRRVSPDRRTISFPHPIPSRCIQRPISRPDWGNKKKGGGKVNGHRQLAIGYRSLNREFSWGSFMQGRRTAWVGDGIIVFRQVTLFGLIRPHTLTLLPQCTQSDVVFGRRRKKRWAARARGEREVSLPPPFLWAQSSTLHFPRTKFLSCAIMQ